MSTSRVKNIIIVCTWAASLGGSVKVAIQSAIGLSNCGYNVVYFSAVGPIADELLYSSVKTICIDQNDIARDKNRLRGIVNGIWNVKAMKAFDDLLCNYDPRDTIIHYHGWNRGLSASIFEAAQKHGIKEVITLHDYFSACPNGAFCNFKTKEICNCSPLSAKCFLTDCDKRNYFQKWFRVIRQLVQDKYVKNNSKMNYIYISDLNRRVIEKEVKSKSFYFVQNPANAQTQFTCTPWESNTFLYVGRIDAEKGVDIFCEAVDSMKKTGLDINGVVLGNGFDYERLKSTYSSIDFLGWVDKEIVKEYMEHARCLILPSRWYEGAPLTIIEANASGLPAIVSDCTTVAETITDGVNGFVFKNGSVEDLKKHIRNAMNNDIICAVHDEIQKGFNGEIYTLHHHIESLVDVYNDILKNV